MSDLHCPVTVLVARAAEPEPESHPPSDTDGSLTVAGRRHAERLAVMLAERNVALIYASPLSPAVRTAEIVAARLACAVRVRAELAATPPGDRNGASTLTRAGDVLDEIADLHRGETVLVVSHGDVISLLLPQLAAGLADDPATVPGMTGCAPVELSADADGWTCTAWPSD